MPGTGNTGKSSPETAIKTYTVLYSLIKQFLLSPNDATSLLKYYLDAAL